MLPNRNPVFGEKITGEAAGQNGVDCGAGWRSVNIEHSSNGGHPGILFAFEFLVGFRDSDFAFCISDFGFDSMAIPLQWAADAFMYRHTQFGWMILFSFLAAIGVVAALDTLVPHPGPNVYGLIVLFLIAVALLFINLTVTVDGKAVRIAFGVGLIRKNFPLDEIESVRAVRNSFWYGWGIRLTPHGWLFNVSGFDAVELQLRNGRRVRIGTDEPERLCETIRARLRRQ